MNGQLIKLRKFEYLTPVLNEWICCIRRYVDLFEGNDLPYWYNERANVSVLAGAAWIAGYMALEEYQEDKISDEGENKKGRNDLYLSNKDNEVCIEAKVSFPDITKPNSYISVVKSRFSDAINDAKKINNDINKIGALFVSPYSKNKVRANDKDISKFIEFIKKYPAPIKAWVFPKNGQSQYSHNDKFYPGVALIMSEP